MITFISKCAVCVSDQRTVEHLLAPFPNGEYAITIEPKSEWAKRQPRTNDQNALMWAYFNDIARLLNSQYGETYWDSQKLHDYFCNEFAQNEMLPSGRPWRRTLKTSRFSKSAMSQFIERVQAYLATEWGMSVPLPGDDDYNEFHDFVNT